AARFSRNESRVSRAGIRFRPWAWCSGRRSYSKAEACRSRNLKIRFLKYFFVRFNASITNASFYMQINLSKTDMSKISVPKTAPSAVSNRAAFFESRTQSQDTFAQQNQQLQQQQLPVYQAPPTMILRRPSDALQQHRSQHEPTGHRNSNYY